MQDAAKPSGRRPLSQLAVVITFTVVFFTLLTQRMMLTSESSTLEMLNFDTKRFTDLLHQNAIAETRSDALVAAAAASAAPPKPQQTVTTRARAMAVPPPPPPKAAWKRPANQSLSDLLQDYVVEDKGGGGGGGGGGRLRGQKVKQLDLVLEERQGGTTNLKPKPKAQPNAKSKPAPAAEAQAKPKPKPKPPASPLDGLPPPPDRGYHPLSSPRPGSDISLENRLNMLRCPNQTKCVVPELQLEAKLKVYFCRHPARHGVRFYYLVREGLHLHPNIELLPFEQIDQADFVVYLPGSSPWHLTECTDKALHSKLLVLDEFDGYNIFHPFERIEQVVEVYGKNLMWYFMYFKRSFVARRDGKFLSHPHLSQPDVYPITYAVADAYVSPTFNFQRAIDILCTLRGSSKMITRMRVQEWIAEYAKSRNVANAITEQVNSATRTTLSQGYFQQMFNSRIIVTVNPANWEGDFRLWESMGSGALVFVDPIFVPHGYPLVDGVHVVFFSNENKTDLFSKLDYYRQHPEEGSRIAQSGYLHAMKYHRTVNLVDYVMRSAHLKRAKLARQVPLPKYKYTAQFLNHQTLKQAREIKKHDRPGAYHHDHLDHHDHSLVLHHSDHHHIIHKHSHAATEGAPATATAKKIIPSPKFSYPSLLKG